MNRNKKAFLILFIGGVAIWAALHFQFEKKINTAIAPNISPLISQSPKADRIDKSAPSLQPIVLNSNISLTSFKPYLRKIGECLQIKNSLYDDNELNFATLQASLRDELGELIANNLDWRNVHISLPNGEKRRLRLEIEGTGEEASGLRLRYYGVDKENLPIPLPLSQEQSMNPSNAFIASLESEGRITLQEEAHRGAYSKGAEIYYVERNGILSELELTYKGKSIKCQELNSHKGTCSCL